MLTTPRSIHAITTFAFVAALAAVCAIPHTARAQVAAADDATPSPIAIILLEPRRSLWTLRARVGGAERNLLFDTGSGVTLLSAAAAKDAGCTPWGEVVGYNMFGKRLAGRHCDDVALEVGGVAVSAPRASVVDMATLSPKDTDLAGVAGLDLFENQIITLDFPGEALVIESPESAAARTSTMQPIPMRMKRELSGLSLTPMVAVPTKSGRLWMELDSGNGGTVLVSKASAALVGLDASATGRQKADFEVVDGIRVQTADAFAVGMDFDGNLGMPFMRNCVITLDLRTGRAWISASHPAASAEAQ